METIVLFLKETGWGIPSWHGIHLIKDSSCLCALWPGHLFQPQKGFCQIIIELKKALVPNERVKLSSLQKTLPDFLMLFPWLFCWFGVRAKKCYFFFLFKFRFKASSTTSELQQWEDVVRSQHWSQQTLWYRHGFVQLLRVFPNLLYTLLSLWEAESMGGGVRLEGKLWLQAGTLNLISHWVVS